MIVAAVVAPHPPALVPGVAVGAALDLEPVRAAAGVAVTRVLQTGPDRVLVVGGADAGGRFAPGTVGSLRPYGVPLDVALGPDAATGAPLLPLSLTIGAWLLARSGWTGDAAALAVPFDAPRDSCRGLGRALQAEPGRTALLVMGDGSARRSAQAPGYLDERAVPYDDAVAAALGRADVAALAALDPGVARDLLVAGRAAWQVLSGAAQGARWDAELLHADAPYGVAYWVAAWTRP